MFLDDFYNRQVDISYVGKDGQYKLKKAKVLCIGMGGLGIPVSLYLASSGIGILGIVDFDFIDVTNLNRQIIYSYYDTGKSKVEIVKNFLEKLNPSLVVYKYNLFLSKKNVYNIFKDYDIVVDCTDNLDSKLLISDVAMELGLPLVYGSVFNFEGYVSVFLKKISCYRCLYGNFLNIYVPNCSERNVMGAVTGVIGSIQALEVIKLILFSDNLKEGVISECLFSKLLIVDLRRCIFNIISFKRNENCTVCSVL